MFLLAAPLLAQQGKAAATPSLDPKSLVLFDHPKDTWPTYNANYSGQRYIGIDQVNQKTVAQLKTKWAYRIQGVTIRGSGSPTIKSTPLMVDGVLYFTVPDHVFAVDARTGKERWQYDFVDHGGHVLGQRGVGMYGKWIYFLTPDGWFISLDSGTGKERWRKKVADEKLQYFTTMAAVIVKNHVIIGVGGDAMDVRGYLESRNPETGELEWRWWSEPLKMGDPGSETWPTQAAMDHGGGMTWMPGTYDPELNLIFWGTGNTNPVFAGQSRKGANLFTDSIVALNPDTGKMEWYFQGSPHDTHDWDNVETPILFDATIDGKPRKLLAQAGRNGYFFVLDRVTGKYLVSKPFTKTANWSKGIDERGQPIPDPDKDPKVDGSMVDIASNGATNWPAPSYSPKTGLFYVNATEGYSVAYLYDTSPNPQGYGGGASGHFDPASSLIALDVKDGSVRWKHIAKTTPGGGGGMSGGILTTAGNLLFTGDSNRLAAFDPASGKILWSQKLATAITNGPSTWELDGKQYVIAGAGDTLYALTLDGK
ncbi:MAG: acido-empty-quinoprotein group A [Edaphobacter sp.]|uniref:acido-empty-quinoprotein group A n=1 Tax=Edaphobacter sp. TaxID=1934404 RepID=UPI002386E75F|nr:acido-empty-quinoprotein group A [Edaphobacter sp.]MDE1176792.1 acido-empty-quinoprotein group A [Edaphobacter sp.]